MERTPALSIVSPCFYYMIANMWGYAWCNRTHVCFPSLSPMLVCGFESCLGLEVSGFSMWHFLKLVVEGFLQVLRFFPLLHRLMVSSNKKKKSKIDAISTGDCKIATIDVVVVVA